MAVEITSNLTETESLKQKINELELKIVLLEKAVEFLAERLDETDTEVGLIANNTYLLKHILQK